MKIYITPQNNCKKLNGHTKKDIVQARVRKKDNPTELISKRATRIDIFGSCSLCDFQMSPLWYFPETTNGSLYLCTNCKDKLLQSKRWSESPLTRREERQKTGNAFFKGKVILTGQVDSNKNKH